MAKSKRAQGDIMEIEEQETEEYRDRMKDYIIGLFDDDGTE